MKAYSTDQLCGCLPYDQVIAQLCASLHEHGLCALGQMDIRKLLREHFDPRFHPCLVLSAGDRAVAQQVAAGDAECLLALCTVMVYDNGDGTSTVETLNPPATPEFPSDDPGLVLLAQAAKIQLRNVLDSLHVGEERWPRG